MNKKWWIEYYRQHRNPSAPSDFAKFVSGFLRRTDLLLDVGCGTGRDSVYLGKFCKVVGIDECTEEIEYLSKHFNKRVAVFKNMNCVEWPVGQLVSHVYLRFFLHAITEKEEDKLIKLIYQILDKNGYLFVEARSILGAFKDPQKSRRFIDQQKLIGKLDGFKLVYIREGIGMASTPTEDPPVVRIVAQR